MPCDRDAVPNPGCRLREPRSEESPATRGIFEAGARRLRAGRVR
jgi:hypothetical protein